MSDDPAPEASAKPAKAPGAPAPKPILLLNVLNLGATGFLVFKVLTAEPAAAGPAHAAEPAGESQTVSGPIATFEPFVVNLDEPGNARYLKTTINLELADKETEEKFEKSKQLVRDAVLSYLSGLHVKDTLGSEAKEKMRNEIMERAQKVLGAKKVNRMFFQEFVVQ